MKQLQIDRSTIIPSGVNESKWRVRVKFCSNENSGWIDETLSGRSCCWSMESSLTATVWKWCASSSSLQIVVAVLASFGVFLFVGFHSSAVSCLLACLCFWSAAILCEDSGSLTGGDQENYRIVNDGRWTRARRVEIDRSFCTNELEIVRGCLRPFEDALTDWFSPMLGVSGWMNECLGSWRCMCSEPVRLLPWL